MFPLRSARVRAHTGHEMIAHKKAWSAHNFSFRNAYCTMHIAYFILCFLNVMSVGKMLRTGNFERTQTLKKLEGTLGTTTQAISSNLSFIIQSTFFSTFFGFHPSFPLSHFQIYNYNCIIAILQLQITFITAEIIISCTLKYALSLGPSHRPRSYSSLSGP